MNPSPGIACREVVDRVTDYFEGALSAAELTCFEQHLSTCAGCRNYAAQMRLVAGALRAPRVPAPAAAKDKLLEMFRRFSEAGAKTGEEAVLVHLAGAALGPHRHICAFFQSFDEQHRVLGPFIKEGLDRGEKAFHVTDPALREEHLKRLAEAGINMREVMDLGQLELRGWRETYLRGGRFDQERMLMSVEEALRSSAATGYPLTRGLWHMEWALLDKPGVGDLLEYEIRLNYILAKYDDPMICTYDLMKFESNVAMDVLRAHPMAIIGGALKENPFYVPPEEFLREIRQRKSRRKPSGETHAPDGP